MQTDRFHGNSNSLYLKNPEREITNQSTPNSLENCLPHNKVVIPVLYSGKAILRPTLESRNRVQRQQTIFLGLNPGVRKSFKYDRPGTCSPEKDYLH